MLGPGMDATVLAGAGRPLRSFYIRSAWLAVAVGLLVADARAWLLATSSGFALPPLGVDFMLYRDAAARWLAGEGFYPAWQLAGPYDVWAGGNPILYPPTALPLFAAFTVLPAILWWSPLVIVAWSLRRASPLALLVVLGLVAWPATAINVIWCGNPSMWAAAALALAVNGQRWAAPFVLLKPTLAPFALFGIRSRTWWYGLAVFGVVSWMLVPLWHDYATAMLNASNAGWTYQLWHVPIMLIPLIAWLDGVEIVGTNHALVR